MRILIVDGHEGWRRLVRRLLTAQSECRVVAEASDGLEAVAKAEEFKPHVIVLEIGLPQLDGIAAARRIRRLVPESQILFVSQETDTAIVEEALNLGIWGYVTKLSAGFCP